MKFIQDSEVGDGKFGCNQNAVKNEHYGTFPKDILQPFNRARLNVNKIWDICYSRMEE